MTLMYYTQNILSCNAITELGDTSLSWFEDLTESNLRSNLSRERDENVSWSEGEKIWSPCPRGGVAAIKGWKRC